MNYLFIDIGETTIRKEDISHWNYSDRTNYLLIHLRYQTKPIFIKGEKSLVNELRLKMGLDKIKIKKKSSKKTWFLPSFLFTRPQSNF